MPAPIITNGVAVMSDRFASEFPSPLSQVLSTTAEEAWIHSPLSSIGRLFDLNEAQGDYRLPDTPEARRQVIKGERPMDFVPGSGVGRHLDQEEAKQMVENAGVPLKVPVNGITKGALDILIERKKAEMARKDILNRGPSGVGAGAAQLIVGLAVTFLDPINVASAFIPIVGPARVAAALARQSTKLGRAKVRASVGAREGAGGAALVEPVILAAADAEQADYDLQDSMLNIAFGAALGSGLHVGIGAVRDGRAKRSGKANEALEEAGHEVREELGRASISQVVNGRIVDVEIVGNFTPVRSVERKVYVPGKGEQTLSQDARVLAGTMDPELMGRYNQLSREKDTLRVEIEEGAAARAEFVDEQLAEIDKEITTLETKKEGLNRRKAKKVDDEIAELKTAREQVEKIGRSQDTPDMAQKRQKLMDLDIEQRDLGPRVNKLLQEAQARADFDAVKTPAEPHTFKVERAFEVDRDFDLSAKAESTFAPDRVRYADHEAAIEATERVNRAGDDTDPIAQIDEELATVKAEYAELVERTGITDAEVAKGGVDVARADELVTDMKTYRKILEAGKSCMARRG